ncbi:MAG: CxxH/CxxC protein [Tissierellales bacterium]|jgi:CxxH/CxxC protein (TIGR04129 family)|nr:CxxH/CxxC protein [Tissierellales bacterium]MBN2827801.1 CxxH/CxxC protein [Tissierellales bacterium]
MKNEIYACEEHIDMAMDDFVNDNEAAPEVLSYAGEKCNYCDRMAVYLVRRPEEFY